jgi:hypothetical protein
VTLWKVAITLTADDVTITRMEIADASLDTVLNATPLMADNFVQKTVAQMLNDLRVEQPE